MFRLFLWVQNGVPSSQPLGLKGRFTRGLRALLSPGPREPFHFPVAGRVWDGGDPHVPLPGLWMGAHSRAGGVHVGHVTADGQPGLGSGRAQADRAAPVPGRPPACCSCSSWSEPCGDRVAELWHARCVTPCRAAWSGLAQPFAETSTGDWML